MLSTSENFSAVEFFKMAYFTASQRKMAEKILLETLKIVELEDCMYSATTKRLIGHFNEMINSFNVQKFWNSLNVREEKAKTQTAQVILQEKEVSYLRSRY